MFIDFDDFMELAHDTLMNYRYISLCKDWRESEYDEEYMFETEEDAEDEVGRIYDYFEWLFNKKELILYRCVGLKDLNSLDREHLGECWAWDEKSARTFGHNNVLLNHFILVAKTSHDNINWEESYKRYFINSFSNYGNEENELVTMYNDDIELLEIR